MLPPLLRSHAAELFTVEIPIVAMPKMGESHLLDIWQGGVGYVNLLCGNSLTHSRVPALIQ